MVVVGLDGRVFGYFGMGLLFDRRRLVLLGIWGAVGGLVVLLADGVMCEGRQGVKAYVEMGVLEMMECC